MLERMKKKRNSSLSFFLWFFIGVVLCHVEEAQEKVVATLRREEVMGALGGVTYSLYHRLSDKVLGEGHERENDPRRRLATKQQVYYSTVASTITKQAEYLIHAEIGNPRQDLLLILDTGSELTWVQCQPCQPCYPQITPAIYDPYKSASFSQVLNSDPICSYFQYPSYNSFCSTLPTDACPFNASYLDGSISTGGVALETLTLTSSLFGFATSFNSFHFGCANHNWVTSTLGESGIMGLDQGPLSFLNQYNISSFAYCFPDPLTHLNDDGLVVFGQAGLTDRLTYTPLLSMPGSHSYYISIVGISVEGRLLPIPQWVFEVDPRDGSGGTIVDSGSFVTYLREPAYSVLRDSFLSFISRSSAITIVPPNPYYDACFNVSLADPSLPSLPLITIYLRSWPDLEEAFGLDLPVVSVITPFSQDDKSLTYCLAFRSSPTSKPNVLGNCQQHNLLVEFDRANARLGLAYAPCGSATP